MENNTILCQVKKEFILKKKKKFKEVKLRENFSLTFFFLILPNTKKYKKLSSHKDFYRNKHSIHSSTYLYWLIKHKIVSSFKKISIYIASKCLFRYYLFVKN